MIINTLTVSGFDKKGKDMTAPITKITQSDLKVFPSERLTDNDDGGGMPLGTPLTGAPNELFDPIPSIVHLNGGIFIRLIYVGVQRADDEPLLGSFIAITKPPFDPNVSYTFFPVSNYGELRAQSASRIESYNVASIESRMTLLSTQTQASKLLQVYQRVGEPLPLVGDVYCLRQDKAGYPLAEQYVQVSRVDSEDRTFFEQTGSGAEFTVTTVKIEISQPLEHDFIGVDYPRRGYVDNPCKVREVSTADAAKYHGVKPITEPILKDTQTIKIASLMEKIVPTSQVETFLTDLNAAGQRQTLFDGSQAGVDGIVTLTVNKTHDAGASTSIYLGNAAIPNSVSIATSNGTITDKGNNLVIGDVAVGTIRAADGELLIGGATFTGYITSVSFRPAGSELQIADTRSDNVSINNRSNIWSTNINPPPAVGSLMASYRAQGRWYDLRDDGTGKLVGASQAHGSGNVNFATGGVELTTGALPDIGSNIMWSWGTRARYFNRADSVAKAQMILQLSQDAVPSTISIDWDDGTPKTATADASGNITGDWTGKYDAATRQISIDTGANFEHPDGVLDIAVTYSTGVVETSNIVLSALDGSGKTTFTAPDFLPNTLRVSYTPQIPSGYNAADTTSGDSNNINHTFVTDDGEGNLINSLGLTVGTIDYDTGFGVFNPARIVKLAKAIYDTTTRSSGTVNGSAGSSGGTVLMSSYLIGYEYSDVEVTLTADKTTQAVYSRFTNDAATSATETVSSGNIEIDLLPTYAEIVMPASVNVSWGGKRYADRNGSIFTDFDAKTGASSFVGSIDYQAAKITLRNWQWTDGAAPIITSLATSLEGNPVDSVTFRTPSAPIKPASLAVRATALDGTLVAANADLSGKLQAANITGFVDTEFGLGDVQFGNWLTAAGNEGEPWYDPDLINDDGKIWVSKMVFASTITYDARSFSYLPINKDVIKIDTVRLPQDGRVAIFSRGDSILIGNRLTDNIGSAHTAGQTVTLSRDDVTRICVSDADSKPVNAELWDYDLLAGTITWKTPLDLAAYKMPLSVDHAREERNVITDTDIDGTLSLRFNTKRSYPVADTYVSSILIGGNLQVRVSIPFTQRNWNNKWSDTPVGEQLLNKLNIRDFPMILTDDGAIKDRWLIKMTGTSTFELYSEALGFVMRGDTLTDLAPINPATGVPYFTLPKEAFGNQAPWAPQDVIRFNTWGTLMPVLVICAVQPSPDAPTGEDGFKYCLYGDTAEITV